MVCLLIGCTREQLEDREFKEKELGEEWIKYKVVQTETDGYTYSYDKTFYFNILEDANMFKFNNIDYSYSEVEIIKLTPRLLLQLLGTECGREILHPNIWVNSLFADYKANGDVAFILKKRRGGYTHFAELPKWIITDMRFPNEFEAVKERNGVTIRVNRHPRVVKHSENVSYVPNPLFDKEHSSETALDNETRWDYVIDNNSTIEDLIKKVREILNKENII